MAVIKATDVDQSGNCRHDEEEMLEDTFFRMNIEYQFTRGAREQSLSKDVMRRRKVLAPTLDPRLYPDSRLQDCIRMLDGNGCFSWSPLMIRIRDLSPRRHFLTALGAKTRYNMTDGSL
ncbi:hypothetical protein ACS0PU_008128 [Formica fusca]